MDSFALAQDSDQGGHSPGSSRTSSTYNMASSIDKPDDIRPSNLSPLEPIVDAASLVSSEPAVLPQEVSYNDANGECIKYFCTLHSVYEKEFLKITRLGLVTNLLIMH